MSVARTRRVLQTIAIQTSDQRQFIAIAAGALTVAALSLAVRYGGLAGAALLIALVAVSVATALWFRLRAAERSHASLTSTVAELTARLDLLSVAAPPTTAVEVPADVAAVDQASLQTVTADPDPNGDATDRERLLGSPLRAPAEPKPLQRVSDAGEPERGRGRGLSSATELLPLQPSPATDVEQPQASLGAETADISDVAMPSGGEAVNVAEPPATPPAVPENMPAFSLTALNGASVTQDVLTGTPAVVVFWRPGCQHCQRLTPELVAWESLQGPRLVVFAACDGPTAFRAGLPGLVILDPGFSVGLALGAPGTPAALPLAADGRPSGPVVAGASAVTTLLLDAMRDWASVEAESVMDTPALGIGSESVSVSTDVSETVAGEDGAGMAPPTVLLRRVEETPSDDVASAPDWDAESVTRRAG